VGPDLNGALNFFLRGHAHKAIAVVHLGFHRGARQRAADLQSAGKETADKMSAARLRPQLIAAWIAGAGFVHRLTAAGYAA